MSTAPRPGLQHALMAPLRWARALYSWVERLALRPAASWLLGVLSFFEAIFFPIPPDVMLIPLGVARPKRALWYASVCLVASALGGVVGYWLGANLMDSLGQQIIDLYGLRDRTNELFALYQQYDAWIVGIAGFTPLPYKLFALTSGAAGVNPVVFVVASLIGRGARFYLIGGLLWIFGPRAGAWIDRNFNKLTIALVLILLGIALLSLL